MKKYVKPELFYERFELSQHIADCMWELTYARNACVAKPDDQLGELGTLFTEAITACFNKDHTYQDYCYENGVDGYNNVFIS